MAAKKKLTVKTREIGKQDVTFDKENANRHTAKGRELVDKSIGELGAGRSVLVDKNGVLIAGNLTTETAICKGMKMVEVETDGDTLIVVKRTDLDMKDEADPRARKMAIVDNSSALFGIDFDKKTLEELSKNFDFGLGEWGVELSSLPDEKEIDYSSKNKEINTDDFEDKCTIFLTYTLTEYEKVKVALGEIAETPELAIWKLLKLEDDRT